MNEPADAFKNGAKSWLRVTPPVRPSQSDLCQFEAALCTRREQSVLIMGLTPELVDLSVSKKANRTTVMEVRAAAIEELPLVAKEDWGDVEFLRADWRSRNANLQGRFSLVLGHGSFVHLDFPDEWISVLQTLSTYLLRDGRIVLKVFCRPTSLGSLSQRMQQIGPTLTELTLIDPAVAHRKLSEITTSLKLHALAESIAEDGRIDQRAMQDKVNSLASHVKDNLGSPELWQTFEPDYGGATPSDYDDVRPLSAPPLKRCLETIEKAGFHVRAMSDRNEIFDGAFHFLHITRAERD